MEDVIKFNHPEVAELYLRGGISLFEAEIEDIMKDANLPKPKTPPVNHGLNALLEDLRSVNPVDLIEAIWGPKTMSEAILLFQRVAEACVTEAKELLKELEDDPGMGGSYVSL